MAGRGAQCPWWPGLDQFLILPIHFFYGTLGVLGAGVYREQAITTKLLAAGDSGPGRQTSWGR